MSAATFAGGSLIGSTRYSAARDTLEAQTSARMASKLRHIIKASPLGKSSRSSKRRASLSLWRVPSSFVDFWAHFKPPRYSRKRAATITTAGQGELVGEAGQKRASRAWIRPTRAKPGARVPGVDRIGR